MGALALLVAAVYSSATGNSFVDWDDGHQIFNNPHLGLGWENLRWMFTNYDYVHRYLPLGWLSYSVDRALFGGGPLSYHVGNLLLHGLNTVLLFVLLHKLLELAVRRTSASSSPEDSAGTSGWSTRSIEIAAALGALWWAVNPLRVEVVAWASARIYCVAIAFMLLSVLCYLRASAESARFNRWLCLSALFFACSLFTYPLALFGLVVFVTLDVFPLRRLTVAPSALLSSGVRRVLAEKVLFLIPAFLVLAVTLWTRTGNTNLGAIVDANQPGVAARVMQSLYVWAYYFWKPWAPFNLAPEYSTLLEFDPWSASFLISAAVLLGLTVWFWKQRKTWPVLLAVWVCHLAMLVPVLGMESFHHYHTTDRYSYLQGICWSVAIAAAVFWAVQRPRWRAGAIAAVLVWTALCAALIPSQISIWKNSLTLHGQIVESLGRNPDRRPGSRAVRDWARHQSFLGQLQMEQKQYAAAEASLRQAMANDPNLADPARLLGQLLGTQGRTAEAIACLEAMLQRHTNEVSGRIVLAVIHGQSGNLPASARQFEEVLRLAPHDASAHHNFAVTLERLGNTNAAATHYARAAELRTGQIAAR